MNIARIVSSLKKRGLKGSYLRWKQGGLAAVANVADAWGFILDDEKIPLDLEEFNISDENKIVLNWVIPEMSKGSGGHTTIFRNISYLEQHGIHNKVYLFRAAHFPTDKSIRDFLKENFPILDHQVEVFCDVKKMGFSHGVVATSWDTAYYVRKFDNAISKFYFVQDFEPYFYAHGSEYEFAENTYKFHFRGITAGDWLKNICINQYGMQADSFHFSYDKQMCQPQEKKDDVKRIFFYARPVTPRRDFELGILALTDLTRKMPDVEVVFAGEDISRYIIPFKHVNKGILTQQELYDIYSQCDLCLVFSNTNLSLLPLEVMGAGSVPVCSKGPNSEWLVNEENAILVDYDPIEISKTLEKYLKNPELLKPIRAKAINFAQKTSWEKESEKVRQAFIKGIKEDRSKIMERN